MKPKKMFVTLLLSLTLPACAATSTQPPFTGDLPLLQAWSGDYPVAKLQRLAAGQRRSATGFIADPETFAAVWQVFKPDEPTPDVDFEHHLVVYSRNTDFYNRTNILKVTSEQGVIEVLAMETMSALPIDDRVAMALAVIPREGIRALKAGDEIVPLP